MAKFFPISKCGKIAYDTEFEAKARAAYLALIKPAQYPEPMRVYACTPCRKWHLTSTPGDAPPPDRARRG